MPLEQAWKCSLVDIPTWRETTEEKYDNYLWSLFYSSIYWNVVFIAWKDPEWFPALSTEIWKVGQWTCSSELHHQVVLSMLLPSVLLVGKTVEMLVCLSRNRKVPAYGKQEQLNSTLPAGWLLWRVLVRTVVLLSVLTRDRLLLRMVLLLDFMLKSTNTLLLLRAECKEGQILSPAKATGKKTHK